MKINGISASNLTYKGVFDKGVKLTKGIAKQSGELFSGITHTITKNGDKVALVYEDGVIQKSLINGKPHKIYTEFADERKAYARKKAVHIIDLANRKDSVQVFHDNGKISKILSEGATREYSENGNLIAKYMTGDNPFREINGEVYYDIKSKTPVLYKKYASQNGNLIEQTFNKSGSLETVKKGGYVKLGEPGVSQLSKSSLRRPDSVETFENGVFKDRIEIKQTFKDSEIKLDRPNDTIIIGTSADGARPHLASDPDAIKVGPKLVGIGTRKGALNTSVYRKGADNAKLTAEDHVKIGKDLKDVIQRAKKLGFEMKDDVNFDFYNTRLDDYIAAASKNINA